MSPLYENYVPIFLYYMQQVVISILCLDASNHLFKEKSERV